MFSGMAALWDALGAQTPAAVRRIPVTNAQKIVASEYGEWEALNDPKWVLLGKHLESQYPRGEVQEGQVDAEGHQRLPGALAG